MHFVYSELLFFGIISFMMIQSNSLKIRLFTSALILSLFSVTGYAQTVHTYVDRDSVRVGDIVTYTLVFDGEYSAVSYPDASAFEEDIELVSRQRFQLSERRDSLVYKLQTFAVEDITIGRKAIQLQTADGDTTVYTTPVPLFFKTILAGDDEEFRPFKPIFDFARVWWPYLLLLFIAAIAAYYFYNWYKNRETEPVEEPLPIVPPKPFENPLLVLKNTISKLADLTKLHSREDYEQFYVAIGDAIRLYIKKVYKFPALEMTTREINLELQKELAPTEIISITRSVLNEADIVKFANFQPSNEQASQAHNKAMEFIKTAEIVHRDQIRYMKYQYDVEHGLVGEHKITEKKVITE
ncbi:MAG: hypothetical protein JJU37_05975 [Balneolaceae bacterium]|nr:hypothetical protein [Balneolaceae bacterium]